MCVLYYIILFTITLYIYYTVDVGDDSLDLWCVSTLNTAVFVCLL